jgi:hypothetical protein
MGTTALACAHGARRPRLRRHALQNRADDEQVTLAHQTGEAPFQDGAGVILRVLAAQPVALCIGILLLRTGRACAASLRSGLSGRTRTNERTLALDRNTAMW